MDALRSLWESFSAVDGPTKLLKGLGYLVALVLLGRALRLVVGRARRREAALGRDSTLSHLLFASQRPTEHALIVLGLYLLSESLPIVDAAHRVASNVLYVLGVFCVSRAVAAAGRELVDGYQRRVSSRLQEDLDVGIFQLIKKLAVLFVWTVGLMTALYRFNIDIMSLAAALGVGSLAIGLAARETLGNMISGFTLLIDRPFREGDRVRLATLEVGDVREIGVRSTRIQLLDLSYLIVPNTELVNQRVVNLTFPSYKLRGAFTLTLAYDTDAAAAKETLLALVRANAEVLADPPPSADILQLADAGLQLEVAFFVGNPRRAATIAEQLRVAASDALRAQRLTIAYPTRTVYGAPTGGSPEHQR